MHYKHTCHAYLIIDLVVTCLRYMAVPYMSKAQPSLYRYILCIPIHVKKPSPHYTDVYIVQLKGLGGGPRK